MINLSWDSGFAANPDQFINRFEQLIPFAPHMRDVFAPVFGGDFAQLDQFFRFRVKRRRINQRRSNAERTRFHFAAYQIAHLRQLLRRRLLVFQANDVLTDRGGAEK